MTAFAPRPTRKPLLALAAAIGLTIAGAVAFQLGGGIESAAAENAKDGSRWSDAFGTPGPVPTPTARDAKADRLSGSASCDDQDWPFVDRKCLVAAGGSELRTVTRTITIEERDEARSTSTLVRLPLAQVALQ